MIAIWLKGGLANRLRTMLGFTYLAERWQRPLYCRWLSNKYCPGPFAECFEPFFRPVRNRLHWEYLTRVRDSLSLRGNINFADLGRTYGAPISDAQIYELHARLRLRPHIRQLVEEATTRLDIGACIGLHVRRTDHVAIAVRDTGSYADDQCFFEIIEQHPNASFFLATDNAVTQRQLAARYPGRIRSYAPIGHSGQLRHTSLTHAVVDAYLLARCQRIYGSAYSSFSTLAHYLSGGAAPLVRLTRADGAPRASSR